MTQWLYRYVFRGIGIVFLIGMLTMLCLQIRFLLQHENPASIPAQHLKGATK